MRNDLELSVRTRNSPPVPSAKPNHKPISGVKQQVGNVPPPQSFVNCQSVQKDFGATWKLPVSSGAEGFLVFLYSRSVVCQCRIGQTAKQQGDPKVTSVSNDPSEPVRLRHSTYGSVLQKGIVVFMEAPGESFIRAIQSEKSWGV